MTALLMWYLPYLTLPYLTLPYLTLPSEFSIIHLQSHFQLSIEKHKISNFFALVFSNHVVDNLKAILPI